MRIEPQVGRRSLHDGGTRLGAGYAASHCALRVERVHCLNEQARECAEQRTVLPEPPRPREWERQHPLARVDLGSTRSTRFADVAHMRRPRHEGQNPRPLHEKATSRLSSHAGQRTRVKPRHSKPQLRNASSSFLACLGQPHIERAIVDRAVERLEVVAHYRIQRRRFRAGRW
jgi:hypothetical protein